MTDIIDQATGNTTTSTTNSSGGDTLSMLVGDGKKFKDAEALARGKLEADNFINGLKNENAELREAVKQLEQKVTRELTLAELLEEVKKASTPAQGNQPPSIDGASITQIVEQRLTEREQEAVKRANKGVVNQALLDKFNDGEAATKYVREVSSKLGMSPSTVAHLAETSPQAFINLFGLSANSSNGTIGNILAANGNTGNNGPSSEVRNLSWYEKKKKEMGFSKYFGDLRLQQQKMKDMDSLGDDFFA